MNTDPNSDDSNDEYVFVDICDFGRNTNKIIYNLRRLDSHLQANRLTKSKTNFEWEILFIITNYFKP